MLKVGTKAPPLVLPEASGVLFHSADLIGSRHLVVFFYPKDRTVICTREACAFRDRYEEFLGLGASVVGISRDGVQSHKRFAEAWELPYPLLSDVEGSAQRGFGAKWFNLFPTRCTFLIDRLGVVQVVVRDQFRAAPHVELTLRWLERSAMAS
jgi:thioredoxin-dependent peroxiredoxin